MNGDLALCYVVFAIACILAIFDRGSGLPTVLVLMAASFRISLAIKGVA